MFAIIQTGGKQYKVSEKDVLEIELLSEKQSDEKVILEEVLLIAKTDDDVIVGAPYVEGAHVELKVVDLVKGDKIRGFKYKAKKRYQRHFGHRQKYIEVEVVKIAHGGGSKKSAAKEEVKAETDEQKVEKAEKKEAPKKAPAKTTTTAAKKPAAKKASAKKTE